MYNYSTCSNRIDQAYKHGILLGATFGISISMPTPFGGTENCNGPYPRSDTYNKHNQRITWKQNRGFICCSGRRRTNSGVPDQGDRVHCANRGGISISKSCIVYVSLLLNSPRPRSVYSFAIYRQPFSDRQQSFLHNHRNTSYHTKLRIIRSIMYI